MGSVAEADSGGPRLNCLNLHPGGLGLGVGAVLSILCLALED